MSEATKRPWITYDGYISSSDDQSVPIRPQHYEHITGPGGGRYEEALANAELIVKAVNGYDAAEQMAEALESCREYFDQRADAEYLPGNPYPEGNEEMDRFTEVEAALASWRKSKGDA